MSSLKILLSRIRTSSIFGVFMCLFCPGAVFWPTQTLKADEISFDAARYLPETTAGYLEITNTSHIVATILDHPIAQHVQTLDVWKKATREQGYRNFLTGRKFFEIQIGTEWRSAIESLTAGGLCIAFDAESQGVVAMVQGKDADTLENFRVKILELTRLNIGESEFPEPYRELPVYRLDQGGAVVVKDWLIVTNNQELGRQVVDRLLDRPADEDQLADADRPKGTLAANVSFQTAHGERLASTVAWGFLDMNAVRKAENVQKALDRQSENPLAELLVGGLQSLLKNSPYVSANATLDQSQLMIQFASPIQPDWIPEHRTFYFGPELQGTSQQLPEVPETLVTLGTYRNVSEMWLRAGDLFDEQMNDSLAEADGTLSTIFSGKDFGEDILGSFEPAFGLIAARQNFADLKPVPAIKLPSFALVASMKNPETVRPDLRRMFQNAVGFFNIVGAQNGNPQLEMDMTKEGEVDMITSRYLPDKKTGDSVTAPIIYNFSPTVAFRGSRFVLSSTKELAKSLVAEHEVQQPSESNTSVQLFADSLRTVLEDNREQLISQNMLEEGHSREEAEAAISLLLELMTHLKGAGIDLRVSNGRTLLNLTLDVNAVER